MGVHDIPAERNLKSGPLQPCAGVDIFFFLFQGIANSPLAFLASLTLGNSLLSAVFFNNTEMGKLVEDDEECRDEEVSSLMRRFLAGK